LSDVIDFKLNFDERFVKNFFWEKDLNRNIKSIKSDYFHLLKGTKFLVKVVSEQAVLYQTEVEINK